jgi:hypothetical protein
MLYWQKWPFLYFDLGEGYVDGEISFFLIHCDRKVIDKLHVVNQFGNHLSCL